MSVLLGMSWEPFHDKTTSAGLAIRTIHRPVWWLAVQPTPTRTFLPDCDRATFRCPRVRRDRCPANRTAGKKPISHTFTSKQMCWPPYRFCHRRDVLLLIRSRR